MRGLEYMVYGDEAEVLELELSPGHSLLADPSALVYMEEGITGYPATGNGPAGPLTILKHRIFSHGAFPLGCFHNQDSGRHRLAFSGDRPGKILGVNLAEMDRGEFICRREAFICMAGDVRLTPFDLGNSQASFIRVTGEDMVFLFSGGTPVLKELSGDTVQVNPACLLGFTRDIQLQGQGEDARSGDRAVFPGLALSGVGTLYLQSLWSGEGGRTQVRGRGTVHPGQRTLRDRGRL